MAGKTDEDAALEIKLDAYVLPDDHRVFKLFPGRRYRLSSEVRRSKTAFLDIRGLDTLGVDPNTWTDEALRGIITHDRMLQATGSKVHKRPAAEDSKRLGYLKYLVFEAKAGDLLVVPLGKGLDGEVAVGEFTSAPGEIVPVDVQDGENRFLTFGRPVRWLKVAKRRRFSAELNKSLHAPTALHLIDRSNRDEIYLAAYGSYTHGDIYVASFPSEKERFTTTDQATIGIWFNSLAVLHRQALEGGPDLDSDTSIYELGIEDSGVELELTKNSPWTPVLRTFGPFAFSALAVYGMAVEGRPLSEMKDVEVSAKTVAGAKDKCKVVIPPDMQAIAKGYGHGRWAAQCRLGKKVHAGATLKSSVGLNPRTRKPK